MRNENALDSLHVTRLHAMQSVVKPDKLAVMFVRQDGHGNQIENVYYTGKWSTSMRMIMELTNEGTLQAFPEWHNNACLYEVHNK